MDKDTSFWERTLDPEIFWNSVGAIGTLLAVVVALALPVILQMQRQERMRKSIIMELDDNCSTLSNLCHIKAPHMDTPQKQFAALRALLPYVKRDAWLAHRMDIHLDYLRCFNELYGEIDQVLEYDKYVIPYGGNGQSNESSDHMAALVSHCIEKSNIFQKKYRNAKRNCRYMNI